MADCFSESTTYTKTIGKRCQDLAECFSERCSLYMHSDWIFSRLADSFSEGPRCIRAIGRMLFRPGSVYTRNCQRVFPKGQGIQAQRADCFPEGSGYTNSIGGMLFRIDGVFKRNWPTVFLKAQGIQAQLAKCFSDKYKCVEIFLPNPIAISSTSVWGAYSFVKHWLYETCKMLRLLLKNSHRKFCLSQQKTFTDFVGFSAIILSLTPANWRYRQSG